MSPDNYHSFGDNELFELMRRDDEYAFRVIYERYRKPLLAYVYDNLHVREASEETVQDVFYWLWANRKTTLIANSLKSYLFTASRNAMLNAIRSAKMRRLYAEDFTKFLSGIQDNSNVEYQNVRDLEKAIDLSISHLPKKCQTVFRMSRDEHIPIPAIAEELNISKKRVENYLTEALKHLRTDLGKLLIVIAAMKL